MIRVVVDRRSGQEAEDLASRVSALLGAPEYRGASGTLYVGSGSGDLVAPGHRRPHLVMPLTATQAADPLVRAQIASADAVILVDHDELRALAAHLRGATILLLEPPGHAGVIHCETPREATDVARFSRECPDLYATLTTLRAMPQPFDYRHVANVITEASLAAQANRVST